MARISAANERVVSIKRFLGLNENPDGDTNLKLGEAAVMSNFKITDDGSLQIRGGTRNVAGLLQNGAYHITSASEESILATDPQNPTSTFIVYPNCVLSSGGILSVSGQSTTLDFAHVNSLKNYCYYKDTNGRIYKFLGCDFVPAATGIKVTGGAVTIGTEEIYFDYSRGMSKSQYSQVSVSNGKVVPCGDYYYYPSNNYVGLYSVSEVFHLGGGDVFKISRCVRASTRYYNWYGYRVSYVSDDVYKWRFQEITTTNGVSDPSVKGIWSGYVGGNEYLVAACGGKLWSLSENNGIWTKAEIGNIQTSEKVIFFGMNKKLYILTGSEYKVWDGNVIEDVVGYVPLIAVATPPPGGGTVFEQANKLTASKRQKFSPNGTATVFQLADKNISRIDWIKHNNTPVTAYSLDSLNGTVTFRVTMQGSDEEGNLYNYQAIAPAGINTIEIQWTSDSNNRGSVLGMKYYEFFNGENDTRVFLYGNGTNKVIYSGIDEKGQPRADYFPELNEAEIGDANTPVTGLTKHYNTLIAFKEDSAYSVSYGTLKFDDGTSNAGFYVLPLNKAIGNTAVGQAMLVENNPRTIDGRSIYEWLSISGTITNDQRNAKRISERIESTLRELNFKNATAFFDKINHEYYVLQGGTALVQNTENDTWYVYRKFPATCMIVYKDEVYLGTADGYIRRFSRDYMDDNGEPISAYFESGSMDFGLGYKKKSSRELWISLKPEEYSGINVTVQTDRQNDFSDTELLSDYTLPASNGVFTSFFELDFSRFSFGTNNKPQTQRLKIKARDFSFYKLIFTSKPNMRATVLGADINVSFIGNVR